MSRHSADRNFKEYLAVGTLHETKALNSKSSIRFKHNNFLAKFGKWPFSGLYQASVGRGNCDARRLVLVGWQYVVVSRPVV